MDYKERELTVIADSLKSISKSLREILERSRSVTDDCSNCFCATCAKRVTCKLKPDEIMPDIYGSPCNGCGKGQRFMPIETKLCPQYKGDANALSLQGIKYGTGV